MNPQNQYTDASLWLSIKKGDEEAFRLLFDRYNAVLYSHVLNKLKDEDESQDIVQDIFVGLWEKKDVIEAGNIGGYLFTAARNKVLNIIKHRKVIDRYENDFKHFMGLYASNNVENALYKRELEAIINAEVAALPPRTREVFELSRRSFLTHREIADQLGISTQTVNDHIKASLKILRTRIGVILLIIWLNNPS